MDGRRLNPKKEGGKRNGEEGRKGEERQGTLELGAKFSESMRYRLGYRGETRTES